MPSADWLGFVKQASRFTSRSSDPITGYVSMVDGVLVYCCSMECGSSCSAQYRQIQCKGAGSIIVGEAGGGRKRQDYSFHSVKCRPVASTVQRNSKCVTRTIEQQADRWQRLPIGTRLYTQNNVACACIAMLFLVVCLTFRISTAGYSCTDTVPALNRCLWSQLWSAPVWWPLVNQMRPRQTCGHVSREIWSMFPI